MSSMSLHVIFYIIILQMTFFSAYTILKMARLLLNKSLNRHVDTQMSPEMTLSLASPYMCTSVRTLRYGWSAVAP